MVVSSVMFIVLLLLVLGVWLLIWFSISRFLLFLLWKCIVFSGVFMFSVWSVVVLILVRWISGVVVGVDGVVVFVVGSGVGVVGLVGGFL